ncbi:hypothetical protein Suden_1629 [Sulfurimonas denitrificans DSM 1251]|uniref:Periplasmic protein n=1 Tax=Sulfurimonas denitrificans (strain ATCC 33889 / DSM 1251) TaxID=326298 RepID=Q30Q25_SULDN|nr:hypothetical protein [Sulfurimonas denitrificans]ABB44906.1 hypothetical protein Suden_1629 [Sulfurimonas denitrificans DSM 1251]
MRKTIVAIALIAVTAAHALTISLPIQYDENSTSPKELEALREALQKVIIPLPRDALSCESGERTDMPKNIYISRARLFSDYQFMIDRDLYLLLAKRDKLSVSLSHYSINSETITIGDNRYFCVRNDYKYDPIFNTKQLLLNKKEPKNEKDTSTFTRFINFFRMQ